MSSFWSEIAHFGPIIGLKSARDMPGIGHPTPVDREIPPRPPWIPLYHAVPGAVPATGDMLLYTVWRYRAGIAGLSVSGMQRTVDGLVDINGRGRTLTDTNGHVRTEPLLLAPVTVTPRMQRSNRRNVPPPRRSRQRRKARNVLVHLFGRTCHFDFKPAGRPLLHVTASNSRNDAMLPQCCRMQPLPHTSPFRAFNGFADSALSDQTPKESWVNRQTEDGLGQF